MAIIAEYTFNSSTDTLPNFEVGFTYTHTDVDNGDGTITRTITSNSSPSSISFNGKTGLVSVSYLNTSDVIDMSYMFEGCSNLVSVNGTGWDTSNVSGMNSMFYDCTSLVSLIGLSDWDTSSVIDFLWVFDNCPSLKEIEIHGWDLSNVTGEIFNCAFYNCSSLEKAILPNWKLPSAPYCFAMFGGCPNLNMIDFTGWNVDYLDNTMNMFTSSVLNCVILNDCNANTINEIIDALPSLSTNGVILTNTDTSSLNVSAANSKSYSFAKLKVATYTFNSNINPDALPTFNDDFVTEKTESRTIFVTMTENTFNIPITSLDDIISIEIPRYEDNGNFQKTVESNSDYIRVEYIDVTSGPYIRIDSTGNCAVGCLEPWDVNENIVIKYKVGYTYTDVDNGDGTITRTIASDNLPTSISFRSKTGLVSLTYLDTSNVTDMSEMFYSCNKLTSIDLSNFNTSSVTTMYRMFSGCTNLTTIEGLSNFNTSNVTDMDSMFYSCDKLTSLDLSSFNTSKVTTMRCMFQECTNLTSLDLSNFNTSKVTNISSMFYECANLTSLDLSSFDTSRVNYMANVFYNCTNLTSIDLSSFNTSKVTTMDSMFYGCTNLTSIDLSNFDTSAVTDMGGMFYNCNNLTSLDLSGFDTSKVTDTIAMFLDCYNLISVNMLNSDVDSINKIINTLPIRLGETMGVMKVLDSEGVDITQANARFWNVEDCKITEIVFDKNINANATVMLGFERSVTYNAVLTPQFIGNIGSVDNFVSIYETNNSAKYEISKFSNIDGVYTYERTNYRLTIENNGNVYATILTAGKTYTFITRFKSFLHSDIDNGDGTVSRVVFCDPQPEIINYTDNSIINVNYLLGDKFTSITSSSDSIVSLNLSGCNTSNVTDLHSAFYGDSLVSVNLSGWNVENVTTVQSMLREIPNLESINISGWKFKKLKYIQCFVLDSPKVREVIMKDSNVESINRVIGELKTRSASSPGVLKTGRVEETTVNYTSANAKFWNVEDDAIARYKFTGSGVLPTFNEGFVYEYTDVAEGTGDIIRTIWSDTVPTSISFEEKSSLSVVTKLNTSGLTSMKEMFSCCNALKSVNFSKSDVSNVTDMGSMFYYCRALTSVTGMENWNTANVTRLDQVFDGCSTLTELDLSSWNVDEVNTFWGAFRGCNKLQTLNLSGWEINGSRDQMFVGCNNLVSIIAKDCLVDDVNTLLLSLPSRTDSSPGTITLGSITGDLSSNRKYWNIVSDITYDKEIFKYTTNGNISCKFNSGLVYAVHDVVNSDYTVTRTCTSNTSPTNITFERDTQMTNIKIDNIDNTITSARNMFYGCSELTSIDLSNFNNSIVTDMYRMFYNCKALTTLDVSNFNTSKVTDMSCMFWGCSKLTSLDLNSFNTSKVKNMSEMFYQCTNLTTLDLNNFNTSNVTDMRCMFQGCTNLTSIDVSSFNTSKVTSMIDMFCNCNNLTSLDLSNFDVKSVNCTDRMFCNCYALSSLDLSNWTFGASTGNMFTYCENLINIKMTGSNINSINRIITAVPTRTADSMGTIKTGNVDSESVNYTTANSKYWNIVDSIIAKYTINSNTITLPTFNDGYTYKYTDTDNGNGTTTRCICSVVEDELPTSIRFESCEGLLSLERLNISNLTTFRKLFYECVNLQNVKGISCYNTVDIIDMSYLFYHCESLTSLDVSKWDTSKVTKMNDMFCQCTNLTTLDLSSFNTSEVIDMYNMFRECTNLASIDLSNFNTSNVTSMKQMFADCKALTTLDLSSFNTSNVTDMDQMFYYCTNLTSIEGLSNFDTSKVTDMDYMFRNCKALTSLDVSKWDTSKVTGMYNMFQGCTNLTSLDLSNWNTSEVTDMDGMFRDCNSLTSLDVSNFDTSKVTDMESMFRDCNSLTLLDLSNFNTSEVTEMNNMFKGCTNLSSLVLNGLDISKVSNMNDMLSDARNIEKIRMKNTDVACVNKIISLLETAIDKGTIYINNRANELPSIDKATATNKNYRICYRGGLNIRDVDKTLNVGGKKIKSITSGPAYL